MKKFTLVLFALVMVASLYGQMDPAAKSAPKSGNAPAGGFLNPKTTALTEGFETFVPPSSLNGWTINSFNTNETWDTASYGPHGGLRNMHCLYDDNLNLQNEWLITPLLDLSPATVVTIQFYWMGSKYWSVYPYDHCDLFCKVSTDGGSTWSAPLWSEHADTLNFVSWTWAGVTLNVPAAAGCATVKFAFQYYGADGAEFAVDDVLIDTIGGFFVGMGNFLHEQEQLKLFPNPASDMISFKSVREIIAVRVYDMMGRQVMNLEQAPGEYLDISGLPEGMYHAEVITTGTRHSRKFIVKR